MSATLRWLGCSTFLLDLGGTRILLDAYVERAAGAAGPETGTEDIGDVDWILVGHSHFDHLWGAAEIALRTGATIVGNYETFRVMREHGVPGAQLMIVSGGERIELAAGVAAMAYPSLHSASWVQTRDPAADEVVTGDLGVSLQERRRRERTVASILESLDDAGREHLSRAFGLRSRGDGGPLVFLITTPAGSLLFQDTAGCWTRIFADLKPDVAILSCAGRGTADGEPWQGSLAEFVAMEVALLGVRSIIPGHHDDWLPGFSTASDVGVIRNAVTSAGLDAVVHDLGYDRPHVLFAGGS